MAQGDDRLFVIPDDGLAALLDVINSAQATLDVYVFQLGSPEIEGALADAQRRHVAVRAIVEPKPGNNSATGQANYDRLKQAGIAVKWGPARFVKTHAKSLVADAATSIISTLNFNAGWPTTRDYGIITSHLPTAAQLAAIFQNDWEDREFDAVPDPESHIVVSPTFGRRAVTDLLNGATRTIDVQHEQLTDPAIIDLLRERASNGVAVRVLGPATPAGQTAAEALRAGNVLIEVVLQTRPHLHAKIIVIDGQHMLLGSHNLTAESLDQRREISILTDNQAFIERVLATFNTDWRH